MGRPRSTSSQPSSLPARERRQGCSVTCSGAADVRATAPFAPIRQTRVKPESELARLHSMFQRELLLYGSNKPFPLCSHWQGGACSLEIQSEERERQIRHERGRAVI